MPRMIGQADVQKLLESLINSEIDPDTAKIPPFLLLKQPEKRDGFWLCYEPGEGALVASVFQRDVYPRKLELSREEYWQNVESGAKQCTLFTLYRLRPMRPEERHRYGLHDATKRLTPSQNKSRFCIGASPDGCVCKMFEGACQPVAHGDSY